jgi:hypothetical protein
MHSRGSDFSHGPSVPSGRTCLDWFCVREHWVTCPPVRSDAAPVGLHASDAKSRRSSPAHMCRSRAVRRLACLVSAVAHYRAVDPQQYAGYASVRTVIPRHVLERRADRLRQRGVPTPTRRCFRSSGTLMPTSASWSHMSPDPSLASRSSSMPIHPNQGICARPNTDWKTLSCGSTVRIPAIAMKYPRKVSVVGSLPDR